MNCSIHPGDFWGKRLAVNANHAIVHQWQQLEASGCIENFRITAGESQALRQGWFFADSDAYKWLEAASLILENHHPPSLIDLVDNLIELIGRAQSPDGYIFTYNQIHFPAVRWQNLQIEHELYCHGHLIEAGVSHYQSTGKTTMSTIACKAADRIVADFLNKGPACTPGHEEIEIALLRLYEIFPGKPEYLEMASQFIEQRGRSRLFGLSLLQQTLQVAKRGSYVRQEQKKHWLDHPDVKSFQLPPENTFKKPPFSTLRWFISALSGKYFQQHQPIRQTRIPVGHSVRFAYLATAAAMLARETNDTSLLADLEQIWDNMVTRRMYVTGGIGSLPKVEGFGRDYELDPEYAYAESCAALASMLWNWEMAQFTGQAQYSDLFEWQLYNAAAVGMGLEGTSYLYNNPLACRGGIERRSWFSIPCCPSNLSRAWATLGKKIYSQYPGILFIHQYISNSLSNHDENINIDMESSLPWDNHVHITLHKAQPDLLIQLRQPSWARYMEIFINDKPFDGYANRKNQSEATASGYDPRFAEFRPVTHAWQAGDVIDIIFEMPILHRRAHSKVKGHTGKIAITRGPLVYCLESIDNPGIDIFNSQLDASTIQPAECPSELGGYVQLKANSICGEPLVFIPYFLWGNRGPAHMNIWIQT